MIILGKSLIFWSIYLVAEGMFPVMTSVQLLVTGDMIEFSQQSIQSQMMIAFFNVNCRKQYCIP